ncbi:hypothetical protein EW146_g3645 [Bondarzewia mesenterica]|uniref:Major facilitator superfamily (MFS) profile domain-containing protein n=1 Tax=Bondarzewia mesenterica TaxID=1095465 RepID=A0A4S4LX76_9AGAM|nr:hypothetical protein EW146_g3645 [Bondarzewia mesenterica]
MSSTRSNLSNEKVDVVSDGVGPKATVLAKNAVDTAAVLTAGEAGVALSPEEAARLRTDVHATIQVLYMCVCPVASIQTVVTQWLSCQDDFCGQDNAGTERGPRNPVGPFQFPTEIDLSFPDRRPCHFGSKGAHLTQNQFNWLGTIFYLSFLVFQYPQNLALQYLPVGKWMAINILVWATALMCHAACKSFGALFAVRFIMGICEGAITPGFMIVTSMFYTRQEQTRRVGYWFLMNGVAIIVLGFVSFGVLHTHTTKFMPWQWLMVITGLITLVTAIVFWFFFPDSPTSAWFLTPAERVLAVQRIKVNQSGLENKHFKRDQFIEALKDPKTWLFALFAALSNILNSLSTQRQLIVNEFGFNTLQTTLIGCVDGVVESASFLTFAHSVRANHALILIFFSFREPAVIAVWVGVTLASSWKDFRAYAGTLVFVPCILGSILVNTLPSHNKIGLLFSYWLSSPSFPMFAFLPFSGEALTCYCVTKIVFGIVPFAIMLGWVGSVTAGHTKRTTSHGRSSPRALSPRASSSSSCASCSPVKTRDGTVSAQSRGGVDDDKLVEAYVEEVGEHGEVVRRRVDKVRVLYPFRVPSLSLSLDGLLTVWVPVTGVLGSHRLAEPRVPIRAVRRSSLLRLLARLVDIAFSCSFSVVLSVL